MGLAAVCTGKTSTRDMSNHLRHRIGSRHHDSLPPIPGLITLRLCVEEISLLQPPSQYFLPPHHDNNVLGKYNSNTVIPSGQRRTLKRADKAFAAKEAKADP